MRERPIDIVILGLSITSSWGNGHATTYRALVRELVRLGHSVLFLERDTPWCAANRDLPAPPYGRTALYTDLADLQARFTEAVRDADLVVVGSFVPDGVVVGDWVLATASGATAFYDIDTPVTVAKLMRGDEEYIARGQVGRYGMYLSFTGGPILDRIERELGAAMARPLYCSVDPDSYFPDPAVQWWDLGYMGTYSADRQPSLDALLLTPSRAWKAGRFVVAGPQYPADVVWPRNVERIEHLPPSRHRGFYNRQRFTLNLTRRDMIEAGFAPSVRLFEAAACGVPIISDWWEGLDTFFEPGAEILIGRSAADVLGMLHDMPEDKRASIGEAARERVLARHTAHHRANELVGYARTLLGGRLVA